MAPPLNLWDDTMVGKSKTVNPRGKKPTEPVGGGPVLAEDAISDLLGQIQRAVGRCDTLERRLTEEGMQTKGIPAYGCHCLATEAETARDILDHVMETLKGLNLSQK